MSNNLSGKDRCDFITRTGMNCRWIEGETYNEAGAPKVILDKDGRCKYHPIETTFTRTIERVFNGLYWLATKNGKRILFYYNGVWNDIATDDGLRLVRRVNRGLKEVNPKMIVRAFEDLYELDKIERRSISMFNIREGDSYGVFLKEDGRDRKGIKVGGGEVDLTECYFTEDFPTLQEFNYKSEDKKTEEVVDRFINSFGGETFLKWTSQYLLPPRKDMGMLGGSTNAGKTAFIDMLRFCFVDGGSGVSSMKAMSIGGRFDFMNEALSKNLLVVIDEADKLSKGMRWEGLFDFLGRKFLNVELKGDNIVQKRAVGNTMMVFNTPPYLNADYSAMQTRITPTSVWMVGKQNNEDVVRMVERQDFKKLSIRFATAEQVCDRIQEITTHINEVNGDYEMPFDIKTHEEWSKIYDVVLCSEYGLHYLWNKKIIPAMKKYLKSGFNKKEVELLGEYYNYYREMSEYVAISRGVPCFLSHTFTDELGIENDFAKNKNVNDFTKTKYEKQINSKLGIDSEDEIELKDIPI